MRYYVSQCHKFKAAFLNLTQFLGIKYYLLVCNIELMRNIALCQTCIYCEIVCGERKRHRASIVGFAPPARFAAATHGLITDKFRST